MNTIFDDIPVKSPKYNKFDLSFEKKMSINFGFLYPFLNTEVLPGDKWRVDAQIFSRLLPLLAPVMHQLDITTHFFFIPNRLVWTNWQTFITGGDQGTSTPVLPTFKVQDANALNPLFIKTGSMLDYQGFPVMQLADTYNAGYNATPIWNALPLKGIHLCYEHFYRDQNIEGTVLWPNFLNDGPVTGTDLTAMLSFRVRAWEKDYLTSALPWTQRGNPVNLPLTIVSSTSGPSPAAILRRASDGASQGTLGPQNAAGGVQLLRTSAASATATDFYIDPNGSLIGTGLTVNALRLSVKLQEFLEKNARGGNRYIETLFNHWGVVSSDARLQRPEFLGGATQPIIISEVLQQSTGVTALGTMAGHGISVGNRNGFSRRFEEHGHVLGLISVKPRTAYQQTMPKMYTRSVQTDFPLPIFAQLGEQAVLNYEAYTSYGDAAAAAGMTATFGYQSRYAEMKFMPSTVSGLFRESLGFWHFGRIFAAQPALNYAFIHSDTTRLDPFAVTTGDHILLHIGMKMDVLRKLPYFGVPNL